MTGIEVTGMIGITTMVSEASTALIPAGASTATKVCVGVGSGLTALAAERIVVREFEGYVDDCKKNIEEVKTIRKIKKLQKAEAAKLQQEELEKLANQEALKVANK